MPRTRTAAPTGAHTEPCPPPRPPGDRPAQNSHSSLHGGRTVSHRALPPLPPRGQACPGPDGHAGQQPGRQAGAARSPRVPCVHDWKLLHQPGASGAPGSRGHLPGRDGALPDTRRGVPGGGGGQPGALTVGGVSPSVPAELPACLLSGFLPLGKLPYSPA